MYRSHPDLIEPPDDAILWRYQSIDKLRSLMDNWALHFARLDKLGDPSDPREGTLPSASAQTVIDFWKIPNKDRRIEGTNQLMQSLVAVNCWHWDDYESSLMWKSYAHPGVAIKTTFNSLKESFQHIPYPVYGGVVQYNDHDRDDTIRVGPLGIGLAWSTFEIASLKYPSYKGEQEVRLIRWLEDSVYDGNTGQLIPHRSTASGVFVEVNLYRLLSELILSPNARCGLEEEVNELVKPINERLPQSRKIGVKRSTLYG